MSEVSQPNEFIETIKKALEEATPEVLHADKDEWPGNENLKHWVQTHYDGIGAFVRYEDANLAANAPAWIRALLEENKQMRQEIGAYKSWQPNAWGSAQQLQQTKEELERSRGSHMFQYGLSLELEIKRLKEELEKVAPSTMATWTHDCNEVNDNYGFQVVARGKQCPFCGKTEASQ